MESERAASSSHPCFVFGFALDGQGGGRALDSTQSSNGPTWLHVDYSQPGAADWLRDAGVPPKIIESLVRFETRPRAVAVEEGQLVVLRGINTNPKSNPEDMVSIRVWIEANRVITVRQRRIFAAQEVRRLLEAGEGPLRLPDLVSQLIEQLADRIAGHVDEIEDEVLAFEEETETHEPGGLRRRVSTLRRQTAILRRFIAPMREALEALCRQAEGRLDAQDLYAIRDQSDRIARAVEDLDLVRERALVVQEELLNRITQQQNDRLYVFSVVAAIFMPISFMTGLFGMNTAGLPGLENPRAFWLVAVAMVAITISMIGYLRSRGWF